MPTGIGAGQAFLLQPTATTGIGAAGLYSQIVGESTGVGSYNEFNELPPIDTKMLSTSGVGFQTPTVSDTVDAAREMVGLSADHQVLSDDTYYLNLISNGQTIPVNESGDLTLSGYDLQSIIGALNEIRADADVAYSKLATVGPVNLKATGSTTIYTVGAGEECTVAYVVLRVAAATTATGDAKVKVEVASDSGDVIPETTLVGFKDTTDGFRLGPAQGGNTITPSDGDAINLNVVAADSGSVLTAYADLIGVVS